MKRIGLYMALGWLIICLLYSCDEQEVDRYENDPRIYIASGGLNHGGGSYRDSLKQSFFVLPDEQQYDTVWLNVRTMGFPTDYNRPVKIVQTNTGEADAAVPGVHYLGFEAPEMEGKVQVDAHQVTQRIPVILLRDPSMEQKVFKLKVAVMPNEHFIVGMDTLSRYTVSMTSMPEKPELWDYYWSNMFGDYGPRKLWFIMRYVGLTDFETRISNYGYQMYLAARAIEALDAYNADEKNEDRPLREADGNPVKF